MTERYPTTTLSLLPRTSCFVKPLLLVVVCIAVVSTVLSGHHMYMTMGGGTRTTTLLPHNHETRGHTHVQHPPLASSGALSKVSSSTSIDDLKRIGHSRVFLATSLEQIHHGIYKTSVELEKGVKSSTLRFAFKTECRPAAKWHGQQGWGEIAVHNLLSIWEAHYSSTTGSSVSSESSPSDIANKKIDYQFENTVPYAVGGIVYVTTSMLNTIIHKDQCGLMTPQQVDHYLSTLSQTTTRTNKEDQDDDEARAASVVASRTFTDISAMREHSALSGGSGTTSTTTLHPLMGVLLTWMPSVDDSAIPLRNLWLKDFMLPKSVFSGVREVLDGSSSAPSVSTKTLQAALLSAIPSKSKSFFKKSDFLLTNSKKPLQQHSNSGSTLHQQYLHLEVLRQISDIMMFDYLLGNEDREEKNWFRDANSGRYILMDNGFVFSGRGYKESICSAYPTLLVCPPLLRHLTKSPTCKLAATSPSSTSAGLCVFRPETVRMLKKLKTDWLGTGGTDEAKGSESRSSSSSSSSLAHKWLSRSKADVLLRYLATTYSNQSTSNYDVPLARNRDVGTVEGSCGKLAKMYPTNRPSPSSPSILAATDGLEFIALALQMRIEKVLEHIDTCVTQYGANAVFTTTLRT